MLDGPVEYGMVAQLIRSQTVFELEKTVNSKVFCWFFLVKRGLGDVLLRRDALKTRTHCGLVLISRFL